MEELEKRIAQLEQYVEERKIQQLQYPLDNMSVDIINNA